MAPSSPSSLHLRVRQWSSALFSFPSTPQPSFTSSLSRPLSFSASCPPRLSSSFPQLRVGCRFFAATHRRAPPGRAATSSLNHATVLLSSEPSRLLFATTLTPYARGVPYLYLILLLPAVIYVAYDTYPPASLSSYTVFFSLTLLPLSFLGLFALFVRFNSRLVSTIHLLPHRRLSLTTVNMLRPSHPIILPLDALIPPFAWSGAADRSLERLRFCHPDGSCSQFFIHPMPNRAEDHDADLLHTILTHNRLHNKELKI